MRDSGKESLGSGQITADGPARILWGLSLAPSTRHAIFVLAWYKVASNVAMASATSGCVPQSRVFGIRHHYCKNRSRGDLLDDARKAAQDRRLSPRRLGIKAVRIAAEQGRWSRTASLQEAHRWARI